MIPILLVAFIMSWSASLWAGDSYSCGSHPMLTSTKEDGSKVGLIISPDQISKTLEWRPGTGEPPLTISKAVQLAQEWAKGEYKRYDGVQVRSISLGEYGCPEQKRHWYYTVYFSPVIEGNVLYGSSNFAAVLMNGDVVGPVKLAGGH
jgi:hypothetical protein